MSSTQVLPKDPTRKVDPSYNSYLEYLTDNLTVGEFADLPNVLGISDMKFNYNMNRPTKLTREMVEAIAEKIHHDKRLAIDLVRVYGLGKEKITLDEAEQMEATKDND